MPDLPTSRETLINVLLEEYKTLRDESHQNMGERLTLLSFPTAAVAIAIAAHGAAWSIVLMVVLLAVYAGVWYRTWRGLDRRAQHLSRLEQRINELALGAPAVKSEGGLLTWETRLCDRRQALTRSNSWIKKKWGRILYHEEG